MKVLVVGGGGRESALARKIAQSPLVERVYCAPGNAGTAEFAINLAIPANDIKRLLAAVEREDIELTVVGPEEALVLGIADVFEKAGRKIFAPRQNAATLEASKSFAKEIMAEFSIPTAKYAVFDDANKAWNYAKVQPLPVVVKADGLAAGKGVYICENLSQLSESIEDIMVTKKFGDSGLQVVIEEFLEGEEASFIAMVDENCTVLPLATSQDHKRVGDGDAGPNTGGMGAYSPAPVVTSEVNEKIMQQIMQPIVCALSAKGRPFKGFLYGGLMIDKEGNPKVLEFNVRMGDPETQPILARMKSDIVPIILAAIEGKLNECAIEWDERCAVTVVLATKGYPGGYQKGFPIFGITMANKAGAILDHAGTMVNAEGQIVGNGGRVMAVTDLGIGFLQAQHRAYDAARAIVELTPDLFCRNDIANRALNR